MPIIRARGISRIQEGSISSDSERTSHRSELQQFLQLLQWLHFSCAARQKMGHMEELVERQSGKKHAI